MFRLLSYLKQCKKSVLAIVLLLIVQAYCDLALPQYTSDIVDVGIQQGGMLRPNGCGRRPGAACRI